MGKRVQAGAYSCASYSRQRCLCDEPSVAYLCASPVAIRWQRPPANRLPFKQTFMNKKIQSALISVFYKDGLENIVRQLTELGITIYSTGGTQKFIEDLKLPVTPVENLTTYPSILGGRVKTLHPSVFGGILGRRDNETDLHEMK